MGYAKFDRVGNSARYRQFATLGPARSGCLKLIDLIFVKVSWFGKFGFQSDLEINTLFKW